MMGSGEVGIVFGVGFVSVVAFGRQIGKMVWGIWAVGGEK
jgi:hypothetical protein